MKLREAALLLCSLTFISFFLEAQIYSTDSLLSVVNAPLENTPESIKNNSDFAKKISSNYPDIAKKLAQRSLKMAESSGDQLNRARALTVLGNIDWRKGNLDESLIRYFEVKEIGEKLNHSALLGSVYTNLSNVYDDLYYLREDSLAEQTAMRYAHKARSIYSEMDERVQLSKINNNIGTMYSLRSEYDSAIHFLDMALETRIILKDTLLIAGTINNIGLVYKRKNEYDKALQYFYQAERLNKKMSDHKGLILTGVNIGNIYKILGDYDQAFDAYQGALKHAEAIASTKWISGVYGQLFGLEYARKNYEEAMEYQELYYKEREKFIENSKSLEIKNIETNHALGTKEIELEKIGSELELGREREKNQALIRNSLIIGILLIVIFGFILFRNQKQKSEREKQYQIAKRGLTQLELENSKLKEKELQLELEHKNKELTSYTVNFIQKNQMLEDLKDMTSSIIDSNSSDDVSKKLRRMKQVMNQNSSQEKDWEDFKLFFESVHTNFFTNLKSSFPELTNTDLKLSALVKLNMNLKETASIFGVEPASIKTARYRLKKKLSLEQEDDLQSFIMGIES